MMRERERKQLSECAAVITAIILCTHTNLFERACVGVCEIEVDVSMVRDFVGVSVVVVR